MPYKTWLLTGALVLMPWVAHAAGLGKLTILSALGRSLLAEIDLVSVQKDELATLTARLAPPEAFAQANIQYSPALVGVRLTIERRADGRPYIRIVSTRPVNDPFLDLLVELNWAQGRLVREYTALIDPPGYTSAAPPVEPAPVESQPIARAAPPVELAPAITLESQAIAPTAPAKPAAKEPAATLSAAPPMAESKKYGPVNRGDTLFKIAASVKPDGVTLEQMLVSLYHANPDAFGGNMNHLKIGTILRIPEKEHVIETDQSGAVKEMRVEAANWNAYRRTLAETARETLPPGSRSAASGRIATAVDDRAAAKETPKEVLKLSKGEAVAGKAGAGKVGGGKGARTNAERMRMLEEEATARENALAEANDRVAQLEKTIKDMQRLLEIKGQVPGAPAAKPVPQPAPEAKPGVTPPVKGDQVAKTEPAKTEPAKDGTAKVEPAKDTGQAPAEAPKVDQKAAPAEGAAAEPPQGEASKAETPKAEQNAQAQPKPKPTMTVQAPPGLIDQILDEPLYLAAGAGLIALLGGAGYWLARRRRTQAPDDEDWRKKAAPQPGKGAAVPPAMVEPALAAPAGDGDDIDPLAEADLYLNFGRDEQAEEVLKEALEKNPKHEEVQLKLLQIYSGRKDKAEFDRIARNLHSQTAGAGDNWLKVAAMGYALDPGNGLYEAGRSAPVVAMPAARSAATGNDLDVNLGSPRRAPSEAAVDANTVAAGPTPLMKPEATMARAAEAQGAAQGAGAVRIVAEEAPAATAVPDFAFEIPGSMQPPAATDKTLDAQRDETAKTNVNDDSAAPKADMIDFEPAVTRMTDTVDFYSNVRAPASAVTGDSAAPMADLIDFDVAALAPAPSSTGGRGYTDDGRVIASPERQEKQAAGIDMEFARGDMARVGTVAESKPEAAKPAGITAVLRDIKGDRGGDTAVPLAPEFRFDDINLNLDDATRTAATKAPEPEGGAKDNQWYDVQTKFDLAKAYQEMGDKDGAREVLQEVIKEGNAGQQAEAVKLLDTLG